MMIRKTARDEHQAAICAIHRRRHKLFRWPVDDPILFSRNRVIAGYTFVAGQNHLWPAGYVGNERGAITAGMMLARCFPNDASVGAAERHEVRVAVVVTVEDDFIAIQNG